MDAKSVALRQSMTLAEFLAWEERQELRTAAHARLQRNLAIPVGGRLRGKPCDFCGSGLKIEVVGSVRYPDAFVVCSPVADRATLVRDPVVIFEILSPSTASTDRITKNREYAGTPSVRRYVMLEQDRIAATVFARIEGEWRGQLLTQADTLHLPEIGTELPLAEPYEGMELPENPDTLTGET